MQQAAAGATAISVSPSMPSKNALRKVIGRVRRKEKLNEPRTIGEINIPEELRLTILGKRFLHRDWTETALVYDGRGYATFGTVPVLDRGWNF